MPNVIVPPMPASAPSLTVIGLLNVFVPVKLLSPAAVTSPPPLALMVISFVPSNATPFILRAVSSFVAVFALPNHFATPTFVIRANSKALCEKIAASPSLVVMDVRATLLPIWK